MLQLSYIRYVTAASQCFHRSESSHKCILFDHYDVTLYWGFVGKTPSSIVYNVDSLSEVLYHVISGGRVSNHRHLVSLTFAVSRIRPSHVIVMMGSNDLDSADPYFNVECLVFRLIAFLTQLRNTNILVSITVLSHDQICAH